MFPTDEIFPPDVYCGGYVCLAAHLLALAGSSWKDVPSPEVAAGFVRERLSDSATSSVVSRYCRSLPALAPQLGRILGPGSSGRRFDSAHSLCVARFVRACCLEPGHFEHGSCSNARIIPLRDRTWIFETGSQDSEDSRTQTIAAELVVCRSGTNSECHEYPGRRNCSDSSSQLLAGLVSVVVLDGRATRSSMETVLAVGQPRQPTPVCPGRDSKTICRSIFSPASRCCNSVGVYRTTVTRTDFSVALDTYGQISLVAQTLGTGWIANQPPLWNGHLATDSCHTLARPWRRCNSGTRALIRQNHQTVLSWGWWSMCRRSSPAAKTAGRRSAVAAVLKPSRWAEVWSLLTQTSRPRPTGFFLCPAGFAFGHQVGVRGNDVAASVSCVRVVIKREQWSSRFASLMTDCQPRRQHSDLPRFFIVGWSNWSARQAHNLEVVGSSPAPTIALLDYWWRGQVCAGQGSLAQVGPSGARKHRDGHHERND